MTLLRTLIVTMLFTAIFPIHAFAQGAMKDVWITEMESKGLFMPQKNHCDSSTEVFIQMGSDSTKGFCIEKTERTATSWVEARQICVAAGKRLPEVAEWHYACNHGSGLVGMTNNWEWASNSAVLQAAGTYADPFMIAPAMGGENICASQAYGYIGRIPIGDSSYTFRCVG